MCAHPTCVSTLLVFLRGGLNWQPRSVLVVVPRIARRVRNCWIHLKVILAGQREMLTILVLRSAAAIEVKCVPLNIV